MGDIHDLRGHGDVLLQRQLMPVEHQRGEAGAQAFHILFVVGAMIQVQHDGDIGAFAEHFRHGGNHLQAGIFDGALAGLDDHGRLFFHGRLHDGLGHFHIVEVECADGITFRAGFEQHFFTGDEWHDLLLYHLVKSPLSNGNLGIYSIQQ